ncbi:hypothetical protein [Paenibacillus solani]|uniref:DUF4367 domain-containing protein n=1 Tax=Paenibacillus solani TaxID=1705565 RepID=A0A0M1P4U2_9BACL|nr:hypothetical protein [Paenibacillus solani]KOR89506.1 hypothetical protein AM231_10390 [Paenibacillus solani]
MSIEEQLKEEFKHNAKNIVCPPTIDLRVMNACREQMLEKKGVQPMRRRGKLYKSIMFILVIAVVSGFAYAGRTLLFEETKGNMTMSAAKLEEFKLSNTQIESIREARKEVKAQLNPGESAVVYLTELDKITDLPFITVSKPEVNEDLDNWSKAMAHQFNVLPPDSLLGSYSFAGGMELSPFGVFWGSETDMTTLKKEMKDESEASGKDMVWRITQAPSSLPMLSYTTTYRNSEQETLYLVMETALDSKIKVQLVTPPSTKYEKMDLNGYSAHYFKNDSYIYTDNNFYQEISWMTEREGRAIIYRIGTDSPSMTKEKLMEAAQSL